MPPHRVTASDFTKKQPPQWHPQPDPHEPPPEDAPADEAPITPVPPTITRRTGCPLSGSRVNGASFMPCRTSNRFGCSPST